ncbi:MAG: TonB-dependent receptor [Bacteroidota bacterium]
MRKLHLLLLLFTVFATTAFAQKTVTGTVSGTDGPLEFATVVVKGTNIGTATDAEGRFTITVPNDEASLVVSFINYKVQEVPVAGKTNLDIVMVEDVLGLDEVVVTAYGTKRSGDITGSIATVNADDIVSEPGVGLQTALRGRAPGVIVTQSSGTPGAAIDVRVRGSTSISATNQPLYVVDGVPLISGNFSQVGVGGQGLNALADINPNDIESITVLKDASTAAIYGSRGANGVVLITTKSGKAGKTKIDFNASYGIQEPAKLIPMVDSGAYRDFLGEIYGNRNFFLGASQGDVFWQEEVFGQGTIEDYSVNFSGGNAKTRFYAGISYHDNEGIIQSSRFRRYSGRLNLDHKASDRLSINMDMGFTNSITNRVRNDNNIFGIVSISVLWPSTVPVRNEDGSFGSGLGWENPVNNIENYQNTINNYRFNGNTSLKYKLIGDLSFKASLGVDALNLTEQVYQPSILQSSNTGTGQVGQTTNLRWVTNGALNYNTSFGASSLVANVGVEFQSDEIDRSFAQVVDFPTDDFSGLSSGATPTSITGSFSGDRLLSYFVNADYNYDERYFLTAVFRADGSSRFVNDKFGYFPGFSAGWRLSNESFLSGLPFTNLMLRAGWGITGNNSIGNFTSLQLFGAGANYLDQPGIITTQLGNPDLRWETTSQTNIGLDFAILDSRVGGSIEYYNKYTQDLLLNKPIPTTTGFASVTENIGEVRNTGFDLSLNFVPVSTPDFNWNLSINGGFNKNEILALFESQPIDVGFATRLAEGHPIGAFFGWEVDGIYQNQAEIDADNALDGDESTPYQPGAEPGDLRFRDISGGAGEDGILGTADDLAPDGVINDADRTFIGQGLPAWTGGITNVLSYKGFELNTFFQFAYGNDIYNNNLEFAEGMHSVFGVTQRAWEGRWQQEGDDADFPRAVRGDPNNNRRNSTRFVEDGSFMRLKVATLSYTFPRAVLENVGIRSLRLYVTGQNVFTWTNYSWFDPEVSTFGVSNTAPGTDFLTYPQARTFVGGINLGF